MKGEREGFKNPKNFDGIFSKIISSLSNRFIFHIKESDWGVSIFVMEERGKGFAQTYWFHDDISIIYFDWLSVNKEEREEGIATEILNAHIEFAKQFNAKSMLAVKEDSWQYEWYKRKGYKEYNYHKTDNNEVWLCRSYGITPV
jgi:GNAT superfamily N-acetyltransferase